MLMRGMGYGTKMARNGDYVSGWNVICFLIIEALQVTLTITCERRKVADIRRKF